MQNSNGNGLRLYDVIIKEFSEDENIKALAELFTGDPIEKGISEESFRLTFMNTVGYDPTTIYDYKRIDDQIDRTDIPEDIDVDEFRALIRRKYVDGKNDHIRYLIDSQLEAEIDDDLLDEIDSDIDESDESFDFDDIEDDDEIESDFED